MPQQLTKSSAEILVCNFWPLAIQILSLIVYTAPKAQHEPQVLWSLIYFIDSQLAHCCLESKLVGIALSGLIYLTGNLSSSGVGRVPIK